MVILLILPIRNGNSCNLVTPDSLPSSFYPTYKEWKLAKYSDLSWLISAFYPTYEEWKLCFAAFFYNIHRKTFYPTYEEWKRRHNAHVRKIHQLFILPMRNGNISVTMIQWCFRNFLSYLWGMETRYCASYFCIFSKYFLSYLWGMETFKKYNSWRICICFLSYLWGMETLDSWFQSIVDNFFLSYLWGMETPKSVKPF